MNFFGVCSVCHQHLKNYFGYDTCLVCSRNAHSSCISEVSAGKDDLVLLANGHVKSPKKEKLCHNCGKNEIHERLITVQEKEGQPFHTFAANELSLKMKMTMKGIQAFFMFLGLKEGALPHEYRRDREQMMFTLYKMVPTFLLGGSGGNDVVIKRFPETEKRREIHVYIPKQLVASQADGLITVVLNFHGGAFCMGDISSPDVVKMLKTITSTSGAVCVSCAYRKSPEFKFPAWCEDSHSAFEFVWEELLDHLPPCHGMKVCVLGDSAGGNIACSLSHVRRDKIFAGLYLYPILNLNEFETESWKNLGGHDQDLLLKRSLAIDQCKNLFDAPEYSALPMASPLLESSFKDVPRNHLMVGGFDPLHDDSVLYQQKCTEAGVVSTLTIYDSCPHGWVAFPQSSEEQHEAMFEICSVLTYWTNLPCEKGKEKLKNN